MEKCFPLWSKFYQPNYISVYPKQNVSKKLSKINHPVISKRLSDLESDLAKIVKSKESSLSSVYLDRIEAVIERVDYDINQSQESLSLGEKRLLLYWKKQSKTIELH